MGGDASKTWLAVRPVCRAMTCEVPKAAPCSLGVCSLQPETQLEKEGGHGEGPAGGQGAVLRKAVITWRGVTRSALPKHKSRHPSPVGLLNSARQHNKSQTPPPMGRERKIIAWGTATFVGGNMLSGSEVGLGARHAPTSREPEAPQQPHPCRWPWKSPSEPPT